MKLSEIKKYPRIYLILLKYSFIEATAYHVSFLTQLFVEFGYAFASIFFFGVVYSQIGDIAGWSHNEMLFLVGLDIFSTEMILGAVSIFNLRRLPTKIKDGEIDFALLKPINSLFQLSLGKPYFTSFISALPGLFLMVYSWRQLGLEFSLLPILFASLFFLCGAIISYSILVIITSLSFVFVGLNQLPFIGEQVFFYKQNPPPVYKGVLRIIFFFVFPIVFVCGIPSSFVLKGIKIDYLLLSVGLASLFLLLAIKIWNNLIKRYTSASS